MIQASVIIVNWNAGPWLESCIKSLNVQTVKPFEVILVDNASSDGSLENIVKKFPYVRVIRAEKNLGFSAGNNLAVSLAAVETSWVVLLNPDAFPEPTWLEALLKAAQRNPEYVFFGSRLMATSPRNIMDGIGDIYHFSGLVWREGHGEVIDLSLLKQKEIFSPCAAAAMYRKDVFLAAGGFDEDYFCYVEDVDLGFRLRLAGYRCLYVPQSVVYHIGSGTTGGQHSNFSVYHGHRNLVWTFVKDMPSILFWLLLPLHVMLNILTVIYFILRGQGLVILKAKWDALLGLSEMWCKRQHIQKTRVVSVGEIWRQLDKIMIKNKLNRN